MPDVARRCLVDALTALRQKRLRMRAHSEHSHLFTTVACEHEITASTTADGTIVVVLDLEFLGDEVL